MQITFSRHASVVLALLLGGVGLVAAEETKPNIIFIMADDMGYGDVQTLNPSSTIPTPNLNRLASQGVTFTDAHTPSAVCTPTRYGVVTGRYCWRTRMKSGVLNGYSSHLINPERATVASMLAAQGYTTGVVGKWHLGLDFAKQADDGEAFDYSGVVANGPLALGFDFFYGVPASLDFPPYVYVRNDRVVEAPTIEQPAQAFPPYLRKGPRSPDLVMANCLDDLLRQAVGFVERESAQDEPFLLYFPLTAPHKPVLPHPRFRGATKLGPYGDFIVQVDWTVGQMLKAIDASGERDNTLVFFTSDNGSFMHRLDDPDAIGHAEDPKLQAFRSDRHTSNGPFRGTKADIWEAGHHVPFFARWPGHVEADTICEETICLTDFFATCAEIVGHELTDDEAEDSFSLLPLLEGNPWPVARPPVIHHSAAGMFAIRDGQWKLVLGNGSGGRQQPRGKPFAKPYHLFDLPTDIGEKDNLIETHADIAARLDEACREIRESGRSFGRER